MPYIVDAKIVFAALIRDSATRELVLDRGLDLRTPPWLWEEVAARYAHLRKKSKLPPETLDALPKTIPNRISDLPAQAIL